jgi:CHAD domain-containing protein
VTATLRAVRGRVEAWPLADEGFGAAARGLRRIHARGHVAMRAAYDRGDDESWHEWRKRVKDLWYAARILEPVAPAQLAGFVADADALSDLLGDHNDVAVLAVELERHAAGLDPEQLELLRAAVVRRREELRRAAMPLGRRLYAERPKALARRLAAYWRARDEERAAEALLAVGDRPPAT